MKRKIKRFLERSYWGKFYLIPVYSKIRMISFKIKARKAYESDKRKYCALNIYDNFCYDKLNEMRCLYDRYDNAGSMGGYFWQDLWAAQLVAKYNPQKHYDIGSSVGGFIAHLASFRENIYLIDVRPLNEKIPGVSFIQADATNLEGIEDNSIESISALCSLEHFGLGRYGDPIDPSACFKAMKSIQRVMAIGGRAYISVPIGKEYLMFNAHRVFYAKTIVDVFDQLELKSFTCTVDGHLENVTDIHKYDHEEYDGGRFGLFEFVKKRI